MRANRTFSLSKPVYDILDELKRGEGIAFSEAVERAVIGFVADKPAYAGLVAAWRAERAPMVVAEAPGRDFVYSTVRKLADMGVSPGMGYPWYAETFGWSLAQYETFWKDGRRVYDLWDEMTGYRDGR